MATAGDIGRRDASHQFEVAAVRQRLFRLTQICVNVDDDLAHGTSPLQPVLLLLAQCLDRLCDGGFSELHEGVRPQLAYAVHVSGNDVAILG